MFPTGSEGITVTDITNNLWYVLGISLKQQWEGHSIHMLAEELPSSRLVFCHNKCIAKVLAAVSIILIYFDYFKIYTLAKLKFVCL